MMTNNYWDDLIEIISMWNLSFTLECKYHQGFKIIIFDPSNNKEVFTQTSSEFDSNKFARELIISISARQIQLYKNI